MFIIQSEVKYVDAIVNDSIDYGTGYYALHQYSDGRYDHYGPFDYEEDARSICPIS